MCALRCVAGVPGNRDRERRKEGDSTLQFSFQSGPGFGADGAVAAAAGLTSRQGDGERLGHRAMKKPTRRHRHHVGYSCGSSRHHTCMLLLDMDVHRQISEDRLQQSTEGAQSTKRQWSTASPPLRTSTSCCTPTSNRPKGVDHLEVVLVERTESGFDSRLYTSALLRPDRSATGHRLAEGTFADGCGRAYRRHADSLRPWRRTITEPLRHA